MGGRGSSFYEKRNAKAEQRLMQHKIKYIPDPESERKNYTLFGNLKTHGISTRKSTDTASLKRLKPHQQQIDKLATKYSNIVKEIPLEREIELSKHSSTEQGYGHWLIGDDNGTIFTRLSLSSLVVNYNNSYVERKKEAIKRNWSVKVEDKNINIYTSTHEFGHLVEENIFRKHYKKLKNKNIDYYTFRNSEADNIRHEVKKICKDMLNNDKLYISTYAEEGGSKEWFAETFTNLELSNKPEPIALALKEYLKRENV